MKTMWLAVKLMVKQDADYTLDDAIADAGDTLRENMPDEVDSVEVLVPEEGAA